MPIPITYKEALRIVRCYRKRSEISGYRKGRMLAPERERLGALVTEFLSRYIDMESYLVADLSTTLPTDLGPLHIHYAPTWGNIFQRFDVPNNTVGSDPHNGKWNFHHPAGTKADDAFLRWREQLARVFRPSTD